MRATDLSELQLAWRRAHLRAQSPGEADVAEPLPERSGRRRALAQQAGQDTRAADALRLRLALRRWARQHAGRATRRRSAVGFWLTAAATLVLAGWLGWQLRPLPSVVYRGASNVAELQTVGDSLLQEVPAILRWPWPEGAERVQLYLFDGEVQLLWQSGWLDRGEVALPQSVQQHMRVGGIYYWRLREAAPGGQAWGRLHRLRIDSGAAGPAR